MKRPRLNMNILENDFNQIVDALNQNNLFACQLEDGVVVMVKKFNDSLDGIMINPKNYKTKGFTSWAFNFVVLEDLYEKVLNDKENNFYSVDIGELSMKDVCFSLVDSLYCLKTGKNYGGYRIRKLD